KVSTVTRIAEPAPSMNTDHREIIVGLLLQLLRDVGRRTLTFVVTRTEVPERVANRYDRDIEAGLIGQPQYLTCTARIWRILNGNYSLKLVVCIDKCLVAGTGFGRLHIFGHQAQQLHTMLAHAMAHLVG